MRPDGDQHVHSFRIQATFVASAVDDSGMIIGYREVSDLLELQARHYAKRFINEVEPFTVIRPTGENIAAVIFRDLSVAVAQRFPRGPELTAVTLWENPSSSIRVSPP